MQNLSIAINVVKLKKTSSNRCITSQFDIPHGANLFLNQSGDAPMHKTISTVTLERNTRDDNRLICPFYNECSCKYCPHTPTSGFKSKNIGDICIALKEIVFGNISRESAGLCHLTGSGEQMMEEQSNFLLRKCSGRTKQRWH